VADLLIAKPQAGEIAAYYGRYIELVPDGDVLGTLATQIHGTLNTLRAISEADSLKRYEPDKWSVREVIGHLIDTERIFPYRALRFARNDPTPCPASNRTTTSVRPDSMRVPGPASYRNSGRCARAIRRCFRGFPPEAWSRRGVASNHTMSVRAMAYVIAGHERHHLRILREKYPA
jgi:hypothetical protein